jgi:hypothetical protein
MRAWGPYAAIELLVPGGSLIVLSLWIFRHRAQLAAALRRALSRIAAVLGGSGAPAAALSN